MGLVGDDTLDTIFSCEYTKDSDVGTYVITPTDCTFTSGVKNNYNIEYVNGTLSADVAAAIAATSIPCVVNASRVHEKAFTDAFSKFVRNETEDADGHYINTYMYFSKIRLWEQMGIIIL